MRSCVIPSPRGVARCLSEVLGHLDAEIVFRMDVDDVTRADRFARQIDRLDAEPDLAVLGAQMRVLERNGRRSSFARLPIDHAEIAYRLCWSNSVHHPPAAFRVRTSESSPVPPSAEEWSIWLEFLARLEAVFASGRIGEVSAPRLDVRRDLARRLFRSMQKARSAGSDPPPEAFGEMKRLSRFYALTKGVL